MNLLEYASDEKPEYAFCESIYATDRSRWCIRALTNVGLKLGGGIDSGSLCGKLRPRGGWDLSVRISTRLVESDAVCQKCATAYAERTKIP